VVALLWKASVWKPTPSPTREGVDFPGGRTHKEPGGCRFKVSK
jgi:hypothetical protein